MVVAVVVALVGQNKKVKAVKELRDSTRLGLADAKALVEAIAAGHRPPTVVLRGDAVDVTPPTAARGPHGSRGSQESPGPSPADLAGRARSLRSQGLENEAVQLVRAETGMGLADAQRFVRALG
nr:ribosomal protein L7/L12 [Actinopolymorpha cephalotaxi]